MLSTLPTLSFYFLLIFVLATPSPIHGYGQAHDSTTALTLRRRWAGLHLKRDTQRKVPDAGFYNPADSGGSLLTQIAVTFPPGQGEPLNAIISGKSDNDVLADQEVNGGLRNYFLSFGFSSECLGQHSASLENANLGDGNGSQNETAVIRWNYGDPQLGTCKETIQGGNHFRYWTQNGPNANSGAVFLAVSYELPLEQGHDILPNGYNLGRDWVVGNITQSPIPTSNLTDGMTYSGTTSSNGYTYQTNINYVAGLLPNTSIGINHNLTVGVGGISAVDGLIAVLTVKITGRPQSENGNSAIHVGHPWPSLALVALSSLLFAFL